MPTSVTIAVTSRAGVTSNAGLRTAAPAGAIEAPAEGADLVGIALLDAIAAPSGVARSIVEVGAAT